MTDQRKNQLRKQIELRQALNAASTVEEFDSIMGEIYDAEWAKEQAEKQEIC